MFQYHIKIVPTSYVRKDGSVILSNQYSVTKHQKAVSVLTGESGKYIDTLYKIISGNNFIIIRYARRFLPIRTLAANGEIHGEGKVAGTLFNERVRDRRRCVYGCGTAGHVPVSFDKNDPEENGAGQVTLM